MVDGHCSSVQGSRPNTNNVVPWRQPKPGTRTSQNVPSLGDVVGRNGEFHSSSTSSIGHVYVDRHDMSKSWVSKVGCHSAGGTLGGTCCKAGRHQRMMGMGVASGYGHKSVIGPHGREVPCLGVGRSR